MTNQRLSFRLDSELIRQLRSNLNLKTDTSVMKIALAHLKATIDCGDSIKHEVMNYEQIV